jgi:hypothetical protein
MRLKLIIEPPPSDPPPKVDGGWLNSPESWVRIVDANTGEPLEGVRSFCLFTEPSDIVRLQVNVEVDAEIDGDVIVSRGPEEPCGITFGPIS